MVCKVDSYFKIWLYWQIQQLEEERDQLSSEVDKLEKQLANQSDQNVNLRSENEELRQQLGIEVSISFDTWPTNLANGFRMCT